MGKTTKVVIMANLKIVLNIGKGEFGKSSTSPSIPGTVDLKILDKMATFAAGLYIVTGVARGGKSMVTRGIAALAAEPSSKFVGVACIYVFEPGAPAYAATDAESATRYFEDASKFLTMNLNGDLPDYLNKTGVLKAPEGGGVRLLVVDNISDAMRSFNSENRAGEAASEGGLMPSDRAFCAHLNNFGERNDIVILGTVNSDLTPFAVKLDGACQGMIQANSADHFAKHERATGRVAADFTIPKYAVARAARSLGYGDKVVSQHSSFIED